MKDYSMAKRYASTIPVIDIDHIIKERYSGRYVVKLFLISTISNNHEIFFSDTLPSSMLCEIWTTV